MNHRFCFLFIGILLILPAALLAQEVYETKTFQSDGSPILEISTSGGHIEVMGHQSEEVRIEMFVKKSGDFLSPGEADLDDYTISMEQNGDKIRAIAKRKTTFGWVNNKINISFTIYTPKRTIVDANTSGGHITLTSLDGKLKGDTSGGHIIAEDISGELHLDTSGGKITVTHLRGNLKAETSGGHITLGDIHGSIVDVETSGGHITLERIAAETIKAETSGGNITANIINVDKQLYLDTSGGNIDVFLPAKRGYSLDLDGSYVTLDGFGSVDGTKKRDRIRGNVHGGGTRIYCDTSGGGVRVKAR